MIKPREYWLIPYYDESDFLCWDKSDFPSNKTTLRAKNINDIHVIEKSSADKLAEALKEIKKKKRICGCRPSSSFVAERALKEYYGETDE